MRVMVLSIREVEGILPAGVTLLAACAHCVDNFFENQIAYFPKKSVRLTTA